MNFHIFHVKSKIFKKPPKNDWFEVRVEIDSVNKKLLFTVPRESNELYEEYETGEPSKEAEAALQQPTIEPQSIDLAEFRPPKVKGDGKETTKKGETVYRLELPGRSRVSGKSLKMSCLDNSMFQEFCQKLRPHFNQGPDGANSASVLSLAQIGRHQSSDSSRQQKPLQPQSEMLDLCGGEYATVKGDDANHPGEGQPRQLEMIVVTSSIYEAFEFERCFQVTFDQIQSESDLPQALRQLNSGDPLHLYVGSNKLELLSREKILICEWPLTQIRSFKHNDQKVQLDVGTRTVTGRALLSFKFDTYGPSAAARFAQVLSNHLALPPECPCCQGQPGKRKELQQDQSVQSDDSLNSVVSGDDEVDEVDEADEENGAGSSDGLCSNPCYYEETDKQGSAPNEKAKRIKKQKFQQRMAQQKKRMLRQTRMKSAEPDYYSSVVRKPQPASKLSVVSPSAAARATAIAASADPPPPQQQQQQKRRPTSLTPPAIRQQSVEAAVTHAAAPQPPPPPPPPPPPREASTEAPDDAYESIVAIPPAEYADDPKFAMQFADAFSQQQAQKKQAQKPDNKPLKVPKKAKK